MRFINRAMTIFLTVSILFCVNTASAVTQELTSCTQLQAPRTVLLVHASWCGHCKAFLPIYKAVSDMPEMKNYTFYTKQNNDFDPVCGVNLSGVPATFTQNMQKILPGSTSKDTLINFVNM